VRERQCLTADDPGLGPRGSYVLLSGGPVRMLFDATHSPRFLIIFTCDKSQRYTFDSYVGPVKFCGS